MKHFISIGIFFLTFQCYSQSFVKTQPYSAANLSQYMWSFSKSSSKPGGKALIDFDVMDSCRGFGSYLSVSDDGSYFAYTINKMVYNEYKFGLFKVDTLVIQSTMNGQRTVFAGLQPGSFTTDSRQYIFKDGGTLCFLKLGTGQVRKIANVASYKILRDKWLAYQLKDKETLNLQNLLTGKEKQFPEVADYNFSKNGEWLICKSKDKELLLYDLKSDIEKRFSSADTYLLAEDGKELLVKATGKSGPVLQYINLIKGDTKIIWEKGKTSIENYCLDAIGKQVAFNVVDSSDAANCGIWYNEAGIDKPVLKISNKSTEIPSGLTIDEFSFTDNGRYLKLSLKGTPETIGTPKDDLAGLEVWNHKDLNLQSAQVKQLNKTKSYKSLFNIEIGKLMFLESDDRKLLQTQGDFALVKKDFKEVNGERFWEKTEDSSWVISLNDGSSHLLPTKSKQVWFSPGGKWLVYFDNNKDCHYYSYDLNGGVAKDISASVPDTQLGIIDRQNDLGRKSGNLAAWIKGDGAVLVYDNYDIWKLDLSGEQAAVNITEGFGQTNSTIFNLFTTGRFSSEVPIVAANEKLLLRAFNVNNKQGGFYRKSTVSTGSPDLIYMGGYFMNAIDEFQDGRVSNDGMEPLKAKSANSWIVQRQSTNDAPNYYETSDFKSFRRLTNYQPQNGYQWYTEELYSFDHLDGKTGQGILFKPENFDSNKKYPVLIAFYGAFSNNMYQFRPPSYIDQAMETGKSPLWFLNNGYLVFTPDISVTPLKYGPQAFNVIEGAAKFLKTLTYVDGNKLGCGSHSWSAKLGAYIFTHSKSISATAITEGFLFANVLNHYLSSKNSADGLEAVEKGQQFGSLWENKQAWLDQTTILNADKSTSPLLLLCNKESTEDYQDQTFQLFNALRRLDKNVWWLKYDKGSHTLSDHKELQDYTIRYTQFFDHYLKNAPAPTWMTEGIPYKLKGIESRYELDPQGKCNDTNGEPCPICEAWNAQYKRTPEMFQKEIKDWAMDKDIADELERKQKEKRKELDKQGEVQTKEVLEMLRK